MGGEGNNMVVINPVKGLGELRRVLIDANNYLLMLAMGPNLDSVIGSLAMGKLIIRFAKNEAAGKKA